MQYTKIRSKNIPQIVPFSQVCIGGFVPEDQLSHRFQPTALFVGVVCFGCQPEPGADDEGSGAAEVADYEPGQESSQFVKHGQERKAPLGSWE